ncbi:F-box and leucine-rich repeat protein 13-like [Amblyomma americanum]
MELSEDSDMSRVLPPELLRRVFSFLGVSDRLSAGLTCKTWHALATDGRLYGDVAFVLETDVRERMEALAQTSSVITWLIVKNTILYTDTEFWRHVGKTLKKLEFESCNFEPDEFVSMIRECPKLEHLTISDCDSIVLASGQSVLDEATSGIPSTMAGINALDLSDNRFMTDAAFHQLITAMGSLSTLSLEGCELCGHPAVYRRFYPPGAGHSTLLMTPQDAFQTLLESGARLRVLNLNHTMTDDTYLIKLCKAYSQTLQELHLASCAFLGQRGVTALCLNVPRLKCLNIARNRQIDDGCLTTICANLKELEELDISGCIKITSEGLHALSRLGKLQHASFSNCSGCEQQGFVKLFSSRPWPGMRTLDMSSCRIDDAVVRCIAEQMPALVSLDVSQSPLLTDVAVRTIWTHLRLLRVLRMERCTNITDAALYGPDNSESCEPASLARLTGLKTLSLNGCYQLSDAGVAAALRFRELTTLDLGHCNLLTAMSLKHVASRMPSLSKLVLSFCVRLDDAGVTLLLWRLPRVRYINIEGCTGITDGLLRNAVRCRPLKYLNVNLCSVTLKMIRWASKERPDLELVHTAQVR